MNDVGNHVHEYRANMRAGLYNFLQERYPDALFFTGTYDLDKLKFVAEPSQIWLATQARNLLAKTGASGIVIAERSRAGRLHVHGLLVNSPSADVMASIWNETIGNTTLTPNTDLFGAVHYLTKAFGPESEYAWQFPSVEGQRPQFVSALDDVVGHGRGDTSNALRRAARRRGYAKLVVTHSGSSLNVQHSG